MDSSAINAANALDAFATAILAQHGDDRPFSEMWGWNCPAVTRHEFAARPSRLAERIRALANEGIEASLAEVMEKVPARLSWLQANTLPQLPGGNCGAASIVIQSAFDWIEAALPASAVVPNWERLDGTDLLPNSLARRLRSIDAGIKRLEPQTRQLEAQIKLISDAHAAAEELPTDLQSLAEARDDVAKIAEQIRDLNTRADTATQAILAAVVTMNEKEKEAAKLIENCEAAYSATTTKGLAAAFDSRAQNLGRSTWIWVGLLMVALAAGTYGGIERLLVLQQLIQEKTAPTVLWANVALSVLSLGAPIWFAWLATKQIGHRFRLAEDYAFKASVAKAYEGYRREAARFDRGLEARLFGSALTRLEEAPLRHIESNTYGSPWHELTGSPVFRRALESVPELKDKYMGLITRKPSLADALTE